MTVTLILFFLVVPLFVSFFVQKYTFLNKIGSVLICYAIGLITGHTALFDETTHQLQDTVASGAVLLALPLLLFDANPRKWRSTAGMTLKSMFIAIVALILVVTVGNALFGSQLSEGWKVGGMLVGVYTGGTPNLVSIKTALDVSPEVFIGVHTIDTILGAIYLLFLMTLGKRWFRKILPHSGIKEEMLDKRTPEATGLSDWLTGFGYRNAALGLGISLLIAAASAGTGLLLPEKYQMTVIILLITTLGIAVAMTPLARRMKNTFPVGMYFINVFSLAVASMANVTKILSLGSTLFYYVSFVLFITFALHLFISKLFKIDADTMMITSTALICSPPFVPVIAGSLQNKTLLIPGLTVGIIGYAVGNYLGVLFAYILH